MWACDSVVGVATQAQRTVPEDITASAVASFDGSRDPRTREIMQSLVRHLHAFAIEVGLTLEEWEKGIGILTATGEITDEKRQEFILWSDTLGLSMIVDLLANPLPEGAMETTVLGPFYVPGAPEREYGANIAVDPADVPAWVSGRVLDLDGSPIAGAEIDVWEGGENRLYAQQDPHVDEDHLRGRFHSRDDGSYAFLAARPVAYTVPNDGPVGAMLETSGRHPWRPAHIHMIVRAPGFHTIATHIFDEQSDYLDSDAVFAVKPSLLRTFSARAADDPDRPAGVQGPWVSCENDIVLARA